MVIREDIWVWQILIYLFFQRYPKQIWTSYTNAPSLHNEKNQNFIPTGLESVAELISKTQSFNAFKYMAS